MAGGYAHVALGVLDDPVMIFGGPCSNLQATQALIAESRRLGIGSQSMICTGDVVAYGADAAGCLRAIRDLGCSVVAGNCERQLAANAAECGCGFAPGTTCDLLSAGWYAHADRTVSSMDRDWMRALPDIATFSHAGRRCAVIHGGLSNISRFLWPVSTEASFAEEIACIRDAVGPVDMVLAGHCGVAFIRQIGDVTWVNAGSIGLPPHDGRTDTRYVVLTSGKPVINRLGYDATAARAAMVAAGLTQGYQTTLTTGVWPGEDVLPREMRRF